ncbi:Nucleosomal histone H3-Lys79 methylase [Tulasnella sp. 418]|nr:Nucleosomal histone H3-Lys79 methylase [Tulasnella sp. 418]
MMHNVLEGWWGVPPMVWKAVVEECYQRCVGPNVKELAKYAPFSNTVYGELNAVFMSDIIHRTGLTEGKMFVDLGCGVGNCLIQTALQAGCIANGIEINPPPAALAKLQVAEFRKRLKMWGLRSGEVNIREGDFCEDEEVKKWMRQADVVLVNNWAFSSTLNATLSLLFLDLPEGSKIVSLKPFRKSDFRITERTASSPEAIFQVEEHEFRKGAVSWTAEGGTYYIHTVDRGPLRAFTERQLVLGASSTGRKRRGGWSD